MFMLGIIYTNRNKMPDCSGDQIYQISTVNVEKSFISKGEFNYGNNYDTIASIYCLGVIFFMNA